MTRNDFLLLLSGSTLAAQQQAPPQPAGADSRRVRIKDVRPKVEPQPAGLGSGSNGRRRALCIGNNAYRYAAPLRNALADAVGMAAALKAARFETTLVTDAALGPSKDAIGQFTAATSPGDSVFFFYAGHGFQLEGGNYLVPVDFQSRDEESATAASIQVEAVLQGLVRRRAHLTALMLDACRNNPFRESSPAGLAPVAPVLGTLAMFATGAGQTADDNPKGSNGLFTSKLLVAIDSGLPLQTFVRKVRDDVFGASHGRQRPYIQEDLVGDFFLKPAAQQAEASVARGSEALMAEGLTLYRAGDFAAAFTAFDKAARIDPANVYAWNAAGAALAQMGRRAQAVELYGRAIETNPAYVAAYVNRGLAFLSEARYPQAIQDFSWALEEDNANPLLYQWRGQADLGSRKYDDGLADLNRALDLDAGSPESYRIRGRLQHRLAHYNEALSDLTRALELKRNFWQALEDRAAVYRAKGQTRNAQADEKAAGELKPRP